MTVDLSHVPDVHAKDRVIPAGKVLLATNVPPEDYAQETILATKPSVAVPHRLISLAAVSAGWALAGSTMRWDNGRFRVQFDVNGSRNSRGFKDLDSALALFNKWTGGDK